jgi:predicted ABC-type ATPase
VQVGKPTARSPLCIIIAGPNGAGKTTFAQEYLFKDVGVVHFVNADRIASGLSLRPELAAIVAGRTFLGELDRLASEREDFAFESTLAGRNYSRD